MCIHSNMTGSGLFHSSIRIMKNDRYCLVFILFFNSNGQHLNEQLISFQLGLDLANESFESTEMKSGFHLYRHSNLSVCRNRLNTFHLPIIKCGHLLPVQSTKTEFYKYLNAKEKEVMSEKLYNLAAMFDYTTHC